MEEWREGGEKKGKRVSFVFTHTEALPENFRPHKLFTVVILLTRSHVKD